MSPTISELQRISKKFQISETKCWLWQGSLSPTGYSYIGYRGKTHRGHRLLYQMLRGETPKELVCDHLCRVRHCINPYHIELVTQRENLERGLSLVPEDYCKRGHKMEGDNLYFIPTRGARTCRACRVYRRKKYYERDKEAKNAKHHSN